MARLIWALLALLPAGGPAAAPVARPTGPVPHSECVRCHRQVADHAVLHAPAAVNACSSCHRLVSVRRHTYELADTGAGLCTSCHDDLPQGRVVHAPLAEGECTACHDPHGGATRDLLRDASIREMCEGCHGDVGAGRYPHAPVATGSCTSCHDAHVSDHANLLHEAPRALCLDCHDEIREATATSAVPHPPALDDDGCLTCHVAHAGSRAALLREEPKDLCLDCHVDVRESIESATQVHAPVAEGRCTTCHASHGSDHPALLSQDYPEGLYAALTPNGYAVCMACHPRAMLTDPQSVETRFRNGKTNLHYTHVGKPRRGRTCWICHDTHAGSNPARVRGSVPYGSRGWVLTIGYERTPGGGRCAQGCHGPAEYDRDAE